MSRVVVKGLGKGLYSGYKEPLYSHKELIKAKRAVVGSYSCLQA
jgi:hypothetical protein